MTVPLVLDDPAKAEDQHTDLVLVSEDGDTIRVHCAGEFLKL